MQSYEEKLELEVSIPRKLYDEWEPTIKVKIKDHECYALCYLGASVSMIPKTSCDLLGFRDFDDCSLNLHLADSTIKKPKARGGHEGGGRPPRARPLPHGPLEAPPTHFFLLYIYPRTPKRSGTEPKT